MQDPEVPLVSDAESQLDRVRLLAVVLPIAYVVAVVGFLAFNPFPSWASALVAVAVSAPLIAGFTALVFNVVNRSRSDLVKREQRFASLLESAPDGIVIVDASGTIVMANHQAERLFGYSKQELVDSPVEMLMPQPLAARHVAHRDAYGRAPGVRPMGAGLDLVARRKDGAEFPVEISLSPISQDGSLLVNAVIRDISERRAFEREREHLLAETETQRERQRIAMDLHDGIIQSIYAVNLGLEATMDDIERASQDDTRRQIDRALNQLDEVTRDIRSYIFQLRPSRIEESLPESLKLLADEFRVNSLVETSLEVAPGVPTLAQPRSLAAYHIAREALNNVRKHSKATRVDLSLGAANGFVRLDVVDNGVGFVPGATASSDHRGLNNMAARAQTVGATLTIDSRPGGGTRVRLDIPLLAKDDAM